MPATMLDLETLGFTRDCVILSIGAVKFDPYNIHEEPHSPLYFTIDVDEQTEMGRVIDDSTMEWWSTQPKEAQDAAFDPDGRIPLLEMTKHLNKYLVGADKIWAQGPLFDINILEHAYIMVGKSAPWQYWQIRDSRTIGDMGNYSAKTDNKSAHNALADSYAQAVGVQQIYHELGVKKR